MSSIIRTNNPVAWTEIDGIAIAEQRPPGPIRGVSNDGVCIVGEFEKGPVDVLTRIGSRREFVETFGGGGPDANGVFYKGYLALLNKPFGNLYILRITNASQTTAFVTFADSAATPVLGVAASSPGAWPNGHSVQILTPSDGVATHFLVHVRDATGALVEAFDNLDASSVATGGVIETGSSLVTLTKLAAGNNQGRPVNSAATALSTASDGTFLDADYTGIPQVNLRGLAALYDAAADGIRWVMVAERYSVAINAALESLAVGEKTKIAVINGPAGQSPAIALANQTAGSDRVIYAYPHVKTILPDTSQVITVFPNSFAAALCAGLAPGEDPAGSSGDRPSLLVGIFGLEDGVVLSRASLTALRNGGIAAFNFASELNTFALRNGSTTSADPALETISRRTMTDFLQESIAPALAPFQNAKLNAKNIQLIKSTIEGFLKQLQLLGLLPAQEDLDILRRQGDPQLIPFVVDTVSGNSPATFAQGLLVIDIRVRIFSSARFIVLRTEIGQGVEINVSEAA